MAGYNLPLSYIRVVQRLQIDVQAYEETCNFPVSPSVSKGKLKTWKVVASSWVQRICFQQPWFIAITKMVSYWEYIGLCVSSQDWDCYMNPCNDAMAQWLCNNTDVYVFKPTLSIMARLPHEQQHGSNITEHELTLEKMFTCQSEMFFHKLVLH